VNPIDLVPKALRRAQLVLMRMRFARSVRPHRVTALGDSITHGLGNDADAVLNLGLHGETTHGLLRSLPYYEHSVAGASAVLLMIGTNDAWQNQTEGIERRLEGIIQAIPADKPVIWSSIPPSGHWAFNLRRVAAVNRFIQSVAEQRPNTAFVDTWALFTDERGFLNYDYFLSDRVHLSPAGYRRWTKALKDALP